MKYLRDFLDVISVFNFDDAILLAREAGETEVMVNPAEMVIAVYFMINQNITKELCEKIIINGKVDKFMGVKLKLKKEA